MNVPPGQHLNLTSAVAVLAITLLLLGVASCAPTKRGNSWSDKPRSVGQGRRRRVGGTQALGLVEPLRMDRVTTGVQPRIHERAGRRRTPQEPHDGRPPLRFIGVGGTALISTGQAPERPSHSSSKHLERFLLSTLNQQNADDLFAPREQHEPILR